MIQMPNIRGDDVSLSSLPSKSASTKSNGSSSKQPSAKKKRNLPGTPDPAAEVVALSPTTLKATNRFICEICNKGFQRDQNLQLHRRGHNLPWKLKRRTKAEVRKRVYICPEPTCMHHDPTRALGDLTGIKKHYNRKHGEKKWKCDKCSKGYAVQSDWKAHQKTCGTKEYRCDCGTIFSRKDSFINHRAFCDALAEEDNEMNHGKMGPDPQAQTTNIMSTTSTKNDTNGAMGLTELNSPVNSLPQELLPIPFKPMNMSGTDGMFLSSSGTLFGTQKGMNSSPFGLLLNPNSTPSGYNCNPEIPGSANFSLLQKAAEIGATASNLMNSSVMQQKCFVSSMPGPETLSIDNVRSCNNFTAQLARNEQHAPFNAGFATQFMDKSPAHDQEVTDKRTGGAGGSAVIYDGMPMKTVVEVQNNSDQSSTRMQGRNLMATTPIRLLGENDAMTVEFLGPRNLDDSRLELELEQTIQMMHNPFHHQL